MVIITRSSALLLRVMYQFSCFFKWFWGCWENGGRWREFWILMIESRTANRCPIKNCEFKKGKEPRKESERRRFVKRNKSLTLLKGSRVFCSSAIHDWNCFSLLGFQCLQLQACSNSASVHRSSSSFNLYAYIKKGRVSAGFRQANSQAGFCLDPDRSHAQVGPPGRSGF